jgi:NADH-quinone oxidoreductase subunit C
MADEAVELDETVAPEPERAYGVLVSWSRGQQVLHPTRAEYPELLATLRADGFDQLADVTAVDYSEYTSPRDLPDAIEPERFEVVVGLLDHTRRARVRLRIQVPGDDPHVTSAFDEYPGSEALEREAADLFGIVFDGHPDPTRILMPEDWIGHPLRKDYALGRIPVQFKGAPANR